MTVSTTANRAGPTTGDGSTTAFAFNYPFRATSDLVVISRVISTGVETVLTEGVDYTVTGTADSGTGGYSSGTVTLASAPASTKTITISREVPATSSYNPVAGAADTAPAREGAIDRLTLLVQLCLDTLKRAPKFNKSTPSSTNIPLPDPPSGSAYQVLAWDTDRSKFVNLDADALKTLLGIS